MKQLWQRARQVPPIGFLAEVAEVYFSRHGSRSAAGLAYFLVLTIFPALVCVSAFVGRLNLDLEQMLAGTDKFLPAGVSAILDEYLVYLETSQSPAMLAVGIFTMVLFASAAVRMLMHTMREIYGRGTFRGVRQLGASVAFSILMLVAIYLSIAVVVTGNWFFHLIGNLFHLKGLAERFGAWQWMKYLLLLGVMFVIILLLYRFTAPLTRPRPPVMTGAFAASVALVLASLVFSAIMSGSTRYSLVYGSLASVIILLVWLYLCGNILILGSVVNYVIDRRKGKKHL